MRWPFVSREMMDRWSAAWELETEAHAETRRHLVQVCLQLAAMQRSGFQVAARELPAPPPYAALAPEIQSALDARFPGNSGLRANALRQVDEWLMANRDPEWIARRIWDGEEAVDG